MTKIALIKTVGKAKLSYEELLTVLVEIESVLNDRPLTYVDEDILEVLTPSHVIYGRKTLSLQSKTGTDHIFQNQNILRHRYVHVKAEIHGSVNWICRTGRVFSSRKLDKKHLFTRSS